MTVLDTLHKGTAYLEKHGVEEARLNMQHLLAHALKCDRMQLYLDFDRPLEEEAIEKLRELTKRRAKGEPLQHLLGTVEFCGREFAVDSRALVPRPETEELVERLLKRGMPGGGRFLDMGSGSGVIGLTLALEWPTAAGVLADVDEKALSLAEENHGRLGIEEKSVEFIRTDLFSSLGERRFDLIVANLPYVAASEWTELSREVQNDPETALLGGEKGTEIMERFLADCGPFLESGGIVAMEFGVGQEQPLEAAAEEGGFHEVRIEKDAAGHDRFLFAVKSPENG